MSDDNDACSHTKVTRGSLDGHPIWSCISCADQFVHVDALKRIEEEGDRIIDMVTGVFTATLWGLHQHVKEAGQDIPADDPPLAEAACEERGHSMGDDGKCTQCGHSPFLGA